jgi:hypothetical protein
MKKKIGTILSALVVGSLALPVYGYGQSVGKTPPCYGNENNATQTALTAMVNAKMIPGFESIYRDDKKPYFLKTTLLDSEKVGKYSGRDYPATDIYRQVQKMNVRTKENKEFEVMTISETSFVECSMSEPVVIVVSPEFQVLSKGKFLISTQ